MVQRLTRDGLIALAKADPAAIAALLDENGKEHWALKARASSTWGN
jgi:hypothetical protein